MLSLRSIGQNVMRAYYLGYNAKRFVNLHWLTAFQQDVDKIVTLYLLSSLVLE